MTLSPGTHFGPFEIVSALGAGGMGEVYRARDTKLNRDVALKILPEAFALDPDRLARFTREAQVLASLNHPNIATIHGLEEGPAEAGHYVRALVLELVEGDTLADRIARGPIPMEETLPIAKQIADALEAAHEQGIIHRDLKPANIKVREDGTVKVLDFGLAKLVDVGRTQPSGVGGSTEQDPPYGSMSPTITTPGPFDYRSGRPEQSRGAMTQMGMILGTAAYMSPEQAKGRPADKRSDIWAFGCVLYEMLTGKRAFEGEDVSDTLANVLKSQPEWTALPPATAPSIGRLLRRTLEKDRRHRLSDAGDARLEIEDALQPTNDAVAPSRTHPLRLHLIWAAGLVTVAVVTAIAVRWFAPAALLPAELRFEIATPPATDPAAMELSPDGEWVVFQATTDGREQLWLRAMNSTVARPLERTDGGYQPFWSPDSRSVGFFAAGKLKRIDLDTGTVRTLADAPVARGGAWNGAGDILFVGGTNRRVFRVPSAGGETAIVLTFDVGASIFQLHTPHFLPDGTHFLFTLFTTTGRGGGLAGVYVAALDGSNPRRLLDADSPQIAYASPFLFFTRQGTLLAQRLELSNLSMTGDPIPVAENVGVVSAAISSSTGGPLLAYRSGAVGPRQRQLVWVTRSGARREKLGDPYPATTGNPAISKDGTTVAVAHAASEVSDLWLVDTRRGLPTRFTSDPFINNGPVWSPDGNRIVFQSNPKAGLDLYEKAISGDRPAALVLSTPEPKMPTDWRSNVVLYQSLGAATGWDLWALPLDTRKPRLVLQTPYEERSGQFSPDGKWIAYHSDESGQAEVYVRPFDGPGRPIRISTTGGAQPRWRQDGRELYYIALDDRLMAVPLTIAKGGQGIEPGNPVPLFPTRVGGALQNLVAAPARQQYMVSPDGSRFLMNEVVEQESRTTPINVIVNWRAEGRGDSRLQSKP